MKPIQNFLLVITLACFSACGVSYVPLTVQRAPEITFADSIVNILVINRFDVNKVDFILRKEKKKEVYNQGINAEVGQLLNELESMKGIRLIEKSDSLTRARDLKANLDSTVLTIGEIQQLAAKYKADYILALENYDAGFVQGEVIKTKNSDGTTSKTAKYSLEVKSSWVMYDKNGKSFRELRGDETRFHSDRSVASALLAIGPALGSNTKFVQNVSIDAGRKVAGYFRSQLVSVTRPLYTDKQLKKSANAIKRGDFVLAQKDLDVLTKDEDVAIASKAYYNLAVIADLKGNKRMAMEFAELSVQKKKNMYASMLMNGLKYGTL